MTRTFVTMMQARSYAQWVSTLTGAAHRVITNGNRTFTVIRSAR